ncbi:MAG: hypothetical protein BWY75_03498 [bacterium ADurb.Bin425]|nr:MAG: hypothetical protein BWY75_03498 [bacterium ADurb.Bin425]
MGGGWNFHANHTADRIEEVHTAEAVFELDALRQSLKRKRRRIRKDKVGLAATGRFHFTVDTLIASVLPFKLFRNCFDDGIAAGERTIFGGCLQLRKSFSSLSFAHLARLDAL